MCVCVSETKRVQRGTGEMAEVRSAPLQLGISAPVVLDGRAAGMSQSRTARDRRQRDVHVAVGCRRSAGARHR